MTHAELIAIERQHLWHPFTPMRDWCAETHEPLMLLEGSGCTLRDQHGREYLDGNASIWTNVHGHAHPTINAAITAQLQRVAHTSFLGFTHPPAIELAKALVDLFPGGKLSRVYYSDNGSTANEAAARMAMQYWQQNGRPGRDTLLSFDRAYHGDTLGAASLGGLPVFKGSGNDFGYRVVCVPSMEALQSLPEQTLSKLAAVVIEPLIQGAAGMRTWPAGMLRQLDAWCSEHDIFLILDEVMTGFGRTGTMFACQREDMTPDLLCLAKGLTGGMLPLAATLVTEEIYTAFLGTPEEQKTFYYGHSYTANPPACAAAIANIGIFQEENTLEKLQPKITFLSEYLEKLRGISVVSEIRQCGFIAGIEIMRDPATRTPFPWQELTGVRICEAARKHGLLSRPILDTLVLMPPLCTTMEQIEQAVAALRSAILEVCGN